MVWRVSGLLFTAAAAFVLGSLTALLAAEGVVPVSTAVLPLALVSGAAAFAWWWPGLRYAHWTYRMGTDALEVHSGVAIRTHSVIPYFRVQHVDTSQGPIERRLGLSNLRVRTASAATHASLPGLSASDAEEIRRIILERAGSGDAV